MDEIMAHPRYRIVALERKHGDSVRDSGTVRPPIWRYVPGGDTLATGPEPLMPHSDYTMRSTYHSTCALLLTVAVAPLGMVSAQVSASAMNTMEITIDSGPDRGTHTVELGAKDINGLSTCSVLPRTDGQAGSYFNGHFYPEMTGGPGLMEAVTAFNVGPNGSTNEASFVVSFLSGTGADMTIRAYEAESRPSLPTTGRASATFARTDSGVTARVEGETSEGVAVTMEVACAAALIDDDPR
jgi:hypothetical protein